MVDIVLYVILLCFFDLVEQDYDFYCYRLRNRILEVKGLKIINSKWQSYNLKLGEYNLCILFYIIVIVLNFLWKNIGYK